jgi:hypothetical protein
MGAANFDLPGEAYVVMVRRGRPCPHSRDIHDGSSSGSERALGA